MDMHEIRRRAVTMWLKGARLPLTAIEAVAKRGQDTSSWPPSVAFEKVEATVKDTVGRVTGDEQLVGLARLQRAEVAKREQSLLKRAEAEAIRTGAAQQADAQRAQAEDLREEVEAAATQREEQVEEARAAAKRQVRSRATKKKTATRKAATAQAKATDRKAKQAERKRLEAEARALDAKDRAVESQGDVLDLDRAVRAKKATRQAG